MKKKGLLTLAVLIALLIAAGVGYRVLSRVYISKTPDIAEISISQNAAPDFAVLDSNGNTVKLSDNYGKPIILNFWATWCGPCRSELPAFNAAFENYGDEITFMMVNLTDGRRETVDGVKNFIADSGYTFPVYYDTAYEAVIAYGINSIPLTVFIGTNGEIVSQQIGTISEATLKANVDALMAR